MRREKEVPPTEAEKKWLAKGLPMKHPGIVCDKCRTKDMQGVRYKCACCKDFDLCGVCEAREYIETLGLAQQWSVTFNCPYVNCGKKDLSEFELLEHVGEAHSKDPFLVSCPVCEANGGRSVFAQPYFSEHLEQSHSNEHNPVTHVLIKLPRMAPPFFYGKRWEPLPPFPMVHDNVPSTPAAMDTSSDEKRGKEESKEGKGDNKVQWLAAEVKQIEMKVVHHGTACVHCKQSPIVGIRYSCFQCPNFDLCQDCGKLSFRLL